jgi:segregation and condensation protein A
MLMGYLKTLSVRLNNFEGPLDLLIQRVQKKEIDIYQIALTQLTQQYLAAPGDIEMGAEFISTTAKLLWFKSKALLPKQEAISEEEVLSVDDPFPHCQEYALFKKAAQVLGIREKQQKFYYPRGIPSCLEKAKPLGIEHLSLGELADLFRKVLSRKGEAPELIEEEDWKVSDKIQWIRQLLSCGEIVFEELFSLKKSRGEWIAIFLAVLELMKNGELVLLKLSNAVVVRHGN